MDLKSINIILHNPSWDVLALFAFIAVGFFYGLSVGRSKLLALIFSLYVSGFLFENFYYLDRLVIAKNPMEEFLFRGFIFFILVVLTTILFSRVLISGYDSGPKNWLKSFLLSFIASGLLFSYLFHVFPGKEIFTFSPLVQFLFASNAAFFWWLFAPLFVLFITRR